MTREEILAAAKQCVCGDRDQDYGSPEKSFNMIAALWEPYIREKCVGPDADVCITGADVGAMMCLFKLARIATGRFKADSYIDAAGYIACAGEAASEEDMP